MDHFLPDSFRVLRQGCKNSQALHSNCVNIILKGLSRIGSIDSIQFSDAGSLKVFLPKSETSPSYVVLSYYSLVVNAFSRTGVYIPIQVCFLGALRPRLLHIHELMPLIAGDHSGDPYEQIKSAIPGNLDL